MAPGCGAGGSGGADGAAAPAAAAGEAGAGSGEAGAGSGAAGARPGAGGTGAGGMGRGAEESARSGRVGGEILNRSGVVAERSSGGRGARVCLCATSAGSGSGCRGFLGSAGPNSEASGSRHCGSPGPGTGARCGAGAGRDSDDDRSDSARVPDGRGADDGAGLAGSRDRSSGANGLPCPGRSCSSARAPQISQTPSAEPRLCGHAPIAASAPSTQMSQLRTF